MAGIVFSNLEAAMSAAHELKDEIDADVYVIKSVYPSGEEFYLSQFERQICVYVARVMPSHIFKPTKAGSKQALEYANKFDMGIRPNYTKKNGYDFKTGYSLVKNKRCII